MKVFETESTVTFRWNLNVIIHNCEEILKSWSGVEYNFSKKYRCLQTATETLKSPRTTKEEVYKTLRKLVETWHIFGAEIDEMKKAYEEDKEVFVIISSGDGQRQIPVLCCLSQKDLFEPEKESEEGVQDTLESLPEVVDEVTIKGVKYKKVLVAKWEKA